MGNCCGSASKEVAAKGQKPGGPGPTDADLYDMFREFDVDGDGFIEEDELKRVLKNIGDVPLDHEIRAMFAAADENGDGKINFPEFCVMFRNITGAVK